MHDFLGIDKGTKIPMKIGQKRCCWKMLSLMTKICPGSAPAAIPKTAQRINCGECLWTIHQDSSNAATGASRNGRP